MFCQNALLEAPVVKDCERLLTDLSRFGLRLSQIGTKRPPSLPSMNDALPKAFTLASLGASSPASGVCVHPLPHLGCGNLSCPPNSTKRLSGKIYFPLTL